MRKVLFTLVFFLVMTIYAQETNDSENLNYDFGTAEGITIYAQRPMDIYVLNKVNGSSSDRRQFIETDFLKEAGFLRTGNAKYRKTNASEKAISLLSDAFRDLTLGLLPVSKGPFYEIEYDKLPNGEFYKFESVFIKSKFSDVSPEVLIVIELEYILQIEFCNGIIIQNSKKYYTDENINKFEELIYRLPDYPENINQVKRRYISELQKIRAALERNRNPGENYLRALENLGDNFNLNRR